MELVPPVVFILAVGGVTGFMIDYQYRKINALYGMVRSHPLLGTDAYVDAAREFATPIRRVSSLVFVPVLACLVAWFLATI